MRDLAVITISVLMICWGFFYFVPTRIDPALEAAAHIAVIVCGIVFLYYAANPFFVRYRNN